MSAVRCPDDKFRVVDKRQGGSDALENVRRQFTDILTTVPDATVILVMSSASVTRMRLLRSRRRRLRAVAGMCSSWVMGRTLRRGRTF